MDSITKDRRTLEAQAELVHLEEELSSLIEEYDHLRLHVADAIEASYMRKLGIYEVKVYEFECDVARMRRKIDLFRQASNRHERVDVAEIEAELDAEWARYEEEKERRLKECTKSLSRLNATMMTPEETRRFKSLYRSLIKALHPDVNPGADAAEAALFIEITKAYKDGDLKQLEALAVLAESIDGKRPPASDTFRGIEMRRIVVEQNLRMIKELIESLKSSRPFDLIRLLDDSDAVAKKQGEFSEKLEQLKSAYRHYSAELTNLLEGPHVEYY